MKLKKIIFLVTVIFLLQTVFSAAWSGTGLDLNASSAKNLSGFKATINYSGADLNAVCFNTSNSTSGASCYSTEQAQPSFTIDLNTSVINLTSDANYSLYAFLLQDDLNYSLSSLEYLIIDSTAPVISASYPANGMDYNKTTGYVFDINFTETGSGLGTPLIILNETASELDDGDTFPVGTGLLNGNNYTITIDVNDLAGNNLNTTITFHIDGNVPTPTVFTNDYLTTWTNDSTPTFTMQATDDRNVAGIALSCSTSGPWLTANVTNTASYSGTSADLNILSSTYGCSASDGNKAVYFKAINRAGNWSTTYATTYVHYDGTAPNIPTGLIATPGSGKAILSWTAATDASSGIEGYKIYKNSSYWASTTNTTIDVNGLTNGTLYTFKIKSYDDVGNESEYSDIVSCTPAATVVTATPTVTLDSNEVYYAKNGQVLNVSCSFSQTINGAKALCKYYNPTQSTATTVAGPIDGVTSVSGTITIAGTDYEKIGCWCATDDSNVGLSAVTIKYVTIDNNAPQINWVEQDNNSNTLTGTTKIVVTVVDNITIQRVYFEIDGNMVNGIQDANNSKNYYTNIDTTKIKNGNYSIKAIALDSAKNITEKAKQFEFFNQLSPEEDATKAISDAEQAKIIVDNLVKYFKEQGLVFPNDLEIKRLEADALFEQAKNAGTDYLSAKQKANSAKESYDEITNKTKSSVSEQTTAKYDIAMLQGALDNSGLSSEIILEAKSITAQITVTRKLVIMKVGEVGKEKLQAKIEIIIINDGNESTVTIREIIPKEFIDSATKLFASHNIRIIQDDPIVEFDLNMVNGENKISYGIGEISEEKAREFIDGNILAKFSSAPLVLPLQNQGIDFIQLAFYGMLILLVIVVLLIIVLFLTKRKGSLIGKDSGILDKIKSSTKIKNFKEKY